MKALIASILKKVKILVVTQINSCGNLEGEKEISLASNIVIDKTDIIDESELNVNICIKLLKICAPKAIFKNCHLIYWIRNLEVSTTNISMMKIIWEKN